MFGFWIFNFEKKLCYIVILEMFNFFIIFFYLENMCCIIFDCGFYVGFSVVCYVC